jgi:hypothetical protein
MATRTRSVRLGLGALVIVMASAGCATSDSPTTSEGGPDLDAAATSGGKFDQTWPKDYGRTTCGEWTNKMSQKQNFVAAADMLVGARAVDNADAGLPSDDLIKKFRDDITDACEADASQRLNGIAAATYLVDKATYKP